ncbi:MAG: FYDLN acid domain-containing protein [Filomicrobium sp.]
MKWRCDSCARPLYDLARTEINCPNCSVTFEPLPVVVHRAEPARA